MAVFWSWIHDPNVPASGVNYRPLPKGLWDGHDWDEQHHRCSNNVPMPNQAFWQDVYPIKWTVTSLYDDVSRITFEVEIDQPGSDRTEWINQSNGSVANQANRTTALGPNLYARGIYISNVSGATRPFTIVGNAIDGEL
jgi:hypothetical protein